MAQILENSLSQEVASLPNKLYFDKDTATGNMGRVGDIFVRSMDMVTAGGEMAEMQDNEGQISTEKRVRDDGMMEI